MHPDAVDPSRFRCRLRFRFRFRGPQPRFSLTNTQLCALKIAQDELEWDSRSGAFDRIAKEEIKAGRAQDAGIKDPVSSA